MSDAEFGSVLHPWPDPAVHCGIVLKSGVRYNGHRVEGDGFGDPMLVINEGDSRTVTIVPAEIAAMEVFTHLAFEHCSRCRDIALARQP